MQDKFRDKVNELIEQRVILATTNQVPQKLLSIARWLGRPIIAQTLFSKPDSEHYWRTEEDMIYDPSDIPMMRFSDDKTYEGGDWGSSEHGFHFDGLKCGINLCITALLYDNKLDELKATYNGYLVFAEIEGELKAYAPFPAWEDAVKMFHEAAVQVEKKKVMEARAIKQEESRKKMHGFWQKFRTLWGY